jgi:hypothetical protein
MGVSTTLVVVGGAIVAASLGLWVYRRSTRPASAKHEVKNQAEQWGVRIAAHARERACKEIQGLLGKEFPIGKKPSLPLPNCPHPHQCECRYVKLFDRRKGERRTEGERRLAQRFEEGNPPRRSGKDRRKNVDWL